jgi:hypothetical protein
MPLEILLGSFFLLYKINLLKLEIPPAPSTMAWSWELLRVFLGKKGYKWENWENFGSI